MKLEATLPSCAEEETLKTHAFSHIPLIRGRSLDGKSIIRRRTRALEGEVVMYSEKVMDHFMNPRNVGEIEDANGIGEVGNTVCGDIMKMFLKIEKDVIVDAKFKTFGCAAAIATSSMATELIRGKTIVEALALTNKAVLEALDSLPTQKIHCSVLAEQAVKLAISDYYKKQGIDPEPIVGRIIGCEGCKH